MKMNRNKFSLSCLLLVAFILLMDPRSFYGLTFHEWAGLVIGVFFIVHILLSWGFVKTVTLLFFGSIKKRFRVNYMLDVLLLVCVGLAIVSGLAIARTIDVSWMGFSRSSLVFWRTLHISSSMIALVGIGIHLGLHWDWVMARIRPAHIVRINKIVLAAALVGLTGSAFYFYVRLDFGQKTKVFFSTVLTREQAGRTMPHRPDSTEMRQSFEGSQTQGAVDMQAMRARRGQRMAAQRPQIRPGAAEQTSEETNASDGREDLALGTRVLDGQRRAFGPDGGRGASISLENVFGYTVILVFVTTLTVLMDGWFQALKNRHRSVRPRV